MNDLYSHIVKEIFLSQEPYLVHDFLDVRNNNGSYNFCFNTCKKVFDETIRVLMKMKYNGEIVLPKELKFDKDHMIYGQDIINKSIWLQKNKIINENGVVKLFASVYNIFNGEVVKREHTFENRDRILLIPIDGLKALANGLSTFSVVIVLQEKDDDGIFQTKSIFIFNPIRKEIFSFGLGEGCKYNGRKIVSDHMYSLNKKDWQIIFVNDSFENNVDLSKFVKSSDELLVLSSIFDAFATLATTHNDFILYNANVEYLPLIEFMCKTGNFELNIENGVYKIVKK